MKVRVKVTIIKRGVLVCLRQAVTVPSLMMMTSIISEESLARDTHAPHPLS